MNTLYFLQHFFPHHSLCFIYNQVLSSLYICTHYAVNQPPCTQVDSMHPIYSYFSLIMNTRKILENSRQLLFVFHDLVNMLLADREYLKCAFNDLHCFGNATEAWLRFASFPFGLQATICRTAISFTILATTANVSE